MSLLDRSRRPLLSTLALLLVGAVSFAQAKGDGLNTALALPRSAPVPASPVPKVFLTTDEALELAFPKAKIQKVTSYLTEAQEERADELAGRDVGRRVVHGYVAKGADGKLLGTAYFDTHVVRSKKEVLMLVVAPDRSLARLEVLAFGEPLEYLPRGKFYDQLKGRKLDGSLVVGGKGVRGVAGATLTVQATVNASRRVLALHQVIEEAAAEKRRREEERRRRGGSSADAK